MARSSVRERHAPDCTLTGTSVLTPQSNRQENPPIDPFIASIPLPPTSRRDPVSPPISVTYISPPPIPQQQSSTIPLPITAATTTTTTKPSPLPPTTAPPTTVDEPFLTTDLENFFTLGLGHSWDPADTAFGSTEYGTGFSSWTLGSGVQMPDLAGGEATLDRYLGGGGCGGDDGEMAWS